MIKQIIEDLYLKPKFVENEANEVLAFYLDKTKNPTYFIKNLVDEERIKTLVVNYQKTNVQCFSLYDVYNNKEIQEKIEEYLTKKYNIKTYEQMKETFGYGTRTWSKWYIPNATTCKVPGFYNTDTVYRFLTKYTDVGYNYYDGSCGWGNRLCGALKADVNYFGTDPNKELYEKLLKMYSKFKKITNTKATAEIKCQGSEIYIPEYENKMDVAFTCPPYFFLEVYTDEQKNILEMSYEDWLKSFMYKTIDNTIKYLKDGGIYAITVKNFWNYKIYDDVKAYLDKNENLEFVELMEEKMPQSSKKIKKLKKVKANVEYIQIYRKKSDKPLEINKRMKLSCLEGFFE